MFPWKQEMFVIDTPVHGLARQVLQRASQDPLLPRTDLVVICINGE